MTMIAPQAPQTDDFSIFSFTDLQKVRTNRIQVADFKVSEPGPSKNKGVHMFKVSFTYKAAQLDEWGNPVQNERGYINHIWLHGNIAYFYGDKEEEHAWFNKKYKDLAPFSGHKSVLVAFSECLDSTRDPQPGKNPWYQFDIKSDLEILSRTPEEIERDWHDHDARLAEIRQAQAILAQRRQTGAEPTNDDEDEDDGHPF